jgi:hypothetical protein
MHRTDACNFEFELQQESWGYKYFFHMAFDKFYGPSDSQYLLIYVIKTEL